MTIKNPLASDVAFTPTVKAVQARKGSRSSYAMMEGNGGWETTITPALAEFIAEQTSVFLGTANGVGQPYIQHRGGPAGFLHVIDNKTIAFADFRGNRQFISLGNLAENPQAFLFLIDYAQRRRVKIWGEAHVVEDDVDLLANLMPKNYKARGEYVTLFRVEAWDANCPQHIPQRIEVNDVTRMLDQRDQRIAELEKELARLAGFVAALSLGAQGPGK